MFFLPSLGEGKKMFFLPSLVEGKNMFFLALSRRRKENVFSGLV